jgi:meso-butanediol dehydrogenase / (S,S)-butanediol dehydrogenase / diacetyl reductase
MGRFDGRVAFVTGAASGIGAATAALLAAEGATVVGADITGDGTSVVHCDVTDPASVDVAVGQAIVDHGGIDVLANVAGVMRFGRVEEVSLADWELQLRVNLTGPFLVSQRALASLRERRGCIVNVASIAGVKGQAYTAAYCASKGGLVLLTKSMALELSLDGVRVNCVCPGGVDTPLIGGIVPTIPEGADRRLMARLDSVIPRMVRPEEVAEAIAYLASDAAAMITGHALLVDGGTQS